MKLLELFNSKTDYKVHKDSDLYFHASAKIGNKDIEFYADNEDRKGWWVSFGSGVKPGDGRQSFFDVTDDGYGAQVLAFVKRAFEDLVKRKDPAIITFSGAVGKDAIYQRMINRFVPKDKYRIETAKQTVTGQACTTFTLFKIPKEKTDTITAKK